MLGGGEHKATGMVEASLPFGSKGWLSPADATWGVWLTPSAELHPLNASSGLCCSVAILPLSQGIKAFCSCLLAALGGNNASGCSGLSGAQRLENITAQNKQGALTAPCLWECLTSCSCTDCSSDVHWDMQQGCTARMYIGMCSRDVH